MKNVKQYTVKELALAETDNEILLKTNQGTELHIIHTEKYTAIKLPFGNELEFIDGIIYITTK